MLKSFYSTAILLWIFTSCKNQEKILIADDATQQIINPAIISEATENDTDDPAIWINLTKPEASLIIGTDKHKNGGLYVFNLEGKIIDSLTIKGLNRPNNVDIGYNLIGENHQVDFAVTTERGKKQLRFFGLPDMKPIDDGGIPVFEGEPEENNFRDLMGVAVYHNQKNNEHYVIVGRKNGPTDGTYLWQYLVTLNKRGRIELTLVRKFGKFSGIKEIEAIAVDCELGYVYYSDEKVGVRKYYAHPNKGNEELALFATSGFKEDHEGISIYKINDGTGYILVSDQQRNAFHIFPREGVKNNPHYHPLIKTVFTNTNESDGSEVTSMALGDAFPTGLFVAMSSDKTFQLYHWTDIAGKDLKIAPNGKLPKQASK